MQMRVPFRLGIILAAVLPMVVWAQAPNYSGTWKLDSNKSSVGNSGQRLPHITLEIKHEGNRLAVKQSILEVPEESPEAVYTTDGKECLNNGKHLKDLVSTCVWEGGKIIIREEGEGARAEGAPGDQPVVEYFKLRIVREFSLSADGSVLTMNVKYDTPEGARSMTFVFDREKSATSA